MLKKLGVITLLFLGGMVFTLGLTKAVFDMELGISFYLHVVIGVIIVIFGAILYKKYC